jgi:hypothetical protein
MYKINNCKVIRHMREERKVYKVLVGKPERKRPLGKPRHRWEDGIRMILVRLAGEWWIGFNWLRIGTGGCECSDEPLGSCTMELVMVIRHGLLSLGKNKNYKSLKLKCKENIIS